MAEAGGGLDPPSTRAATNALGRKVLGLRLLPSPLPIRTQALPGRLPFIYSPNSFAATAVRRPFVGARPAVLRPAPQLRLPPYRFVVVGSGCRVGFQRIGWEGVRCHAHAVAVVGLCGRPTTSLTPSPQRTNGAWYALCSAAGWPGSGVTGWACWQKETRSGLQSLALPSELPGLRAGLTRPRLLLNQARVPTFRRCASGDVQFARNRH